MYKGVKYFDAGNICINRLEDIYDNTGKHKTLAKREMHKSIRTRLKVELKAEVQDYENQVEDIEQLRHTMCEDYMVCPHYTGYAEDHCSKCPANSENFEECFKGGIADSLWRR